MELRYYFHLFRRWAWLVALALLLGAGAAFVFSRLQSPVYEAVTYVTIVTPQRTQISPASELTDRELADTYLALLKRRPVLEAASRESGVEIKEEQISASLVTGTRMLEVRAEGSSAREAAAIANALVAVLAEESELLQVGEYASTQAALEEQVAEVAGRIAALQADVAARVASEVAGATAEQDALLAEIDNLQGEVLALQQEVDTLLAPQLSAAEEAELASARAELAAAELELALASSLYASTVAETPGAADEVTRERLRELQLQALTLDERIQELTTLGPPADPAAREQLVTAQTELARKQFDRQLATSRYLDLAATIQRKEEEVTEGGTAQERATLQLYTQLHGSLINSLESVRLARLQNSSSLSVVEEAEPPEGPVRPRPLLNAVLGGLVAVMAAAGLVLLMDYLDTSVKTAEDVALLTGLPILGAIGQARRGQGATGLAVVDAPESRQAEAFRTLRTNLEFATGEQPLRTLLVTSPEDGAGKTTVAANLAAAFAQSGQETVLVDADVRRPQLHALLGLSNERGLGDVLPAGAGSAARARERTGTGTRAGLGYKAGAGYKPSSAGGVDASFAQPLPQLPGLKVLASGTLPAQPYELLGGERTAAPLRALQEAYGMVVLDSPPLVVADAARLAPQVDGVLLVVRPGQTSAEALLAALDQLDRAGARLLGIVLNRVPRGTGLYPRTYARAARPPLPAAELPPALGDAELEAGELGEVGG